MEYSIRNNDKADTIFQLRLPLSTIPAKWFPFPEMCSYKMCIQYIIAPRLTTQMLLVMIFLKFDYFVQCFQSNILPIRLNNL